MKYENKNAVLVPQSDLSREAPAGNPGYEGTPEGGAGPCGEPQQQWPLREFLEDPHVELQRQEGVRHAKHTVGDTVSKPCRTVSLKPFLKPAVKVLSPIAQLRY